MTVQWADVDYQLKYLPYVEQLEKPTYKQCKGASSANSLFFLIISLHFPDAMSQNRWDKEQKY